MVTQTHIAEATGWVPGDRKRARKFIDSDFSERAETWRTDPRETTACFSWFKNFSMPQNRFSSYWHLYLWEERETRLAACLPA
ncbi:TFDP2 isoform 19 [Pan troglodytes]|uniref:TFDP2 isoform 19 n=1 Tax=Pan troglodytes TaxID=9598 RepID=A0A2J8P386_PANTR|nr:TFDP2 isoform 19 [Pan troglodytes]